MIRDRDIIVIGIQAWDIEIGSNGKNIAAEFAKHNRVLYVNPPVDRISMFRERKTPKMMRRSEIRKGHKKNLIKLGHNLWNLYPIEVTESINFIGLPVLFDLLNWVNTVRFTNDIQYAIDRLEFRDYIVFNDSSMFLGQHIRKQLSPAAYVYYMRDYLTKNPYWKKHGQRLEPRLIADADCVVNNSTLYAEYGAQYNPHSYMVGQGCDTEAFDNESRTIEVAEDLREIPGPIIGYVGFLSSRRLNPNILAHIARSRPDWNVVLVGPEDEVFQESELHQLSNVIFLGSKPGEQLPRYIEGFDVAINPQRINDATMGNYPRKIDEYLAMGKPVVASATKAMEYFEDYTYLGETPQDYVDLIAKALKEDNTTRQKARRKFGRSHSWENNVKAIYDCILRVKGEAFENAEVAETTPRELTL